MLRSLIALCLALTLMPAGVRADPLPQMTARVWHVQDGLTDQVIQAVVQGPDHALWIKNPLFPTKAAASRSGLSFYCPQLP